MYGNCQSVIEESWDYVYDGDGVLKKEIHTYEDENQQPATETRLILGGGSYVVENWNTENEEVIKTYSFNGQKVAQRTEEGLEYFITDHLGSVSAIIDASGTLISQQGECVAFA